MENSNPFEKPLSKDDFSGYGIPRHNAKVMKQGLEENNAPFLPDTSGNIKVDPIINLTTGYCLPANRLIPVQFAKMEKGYTSSFVATRTAIGSMENSILENEKGVLYNFKNESGEFHTAALFFPEQTASPEVFISKARENLKDQNTLKDVSMVIATSEPKEYLGTYMAACKSGMKLSVDPQIAEEFKSKLIPVLENDLRKSEDRNKELPSLSNFLFDADKRGIEIVKSLSEENSRSAEPQKKKSIEREMDMCF